MQLEQPGRVAEAVMDCDAGYDLLTEVANAASASP